MLTKENLACIFLLGVILITVVIPISYVFWNKEKTAKAFLLLAFAIILNAFMKSIWKVGEVEGDPNHWYYPSGHMITGLVFWGWLAWEVGNKYFTGLVFGLLLGIAWGLVELGFHEWFHVQGSWFYGLGLLIGYYFLWKFPLFQKRPYLMGLPLLSLAIPIIASLPIELQNRYNHIWVGLAILASLPIAWFFDNKRKQKLSVIQRFIALLLALAGATWIRSNINLLHPYMPSHQAVLVANIALVMWVCTTCNGIIHWIYNCLNLYSKEKFQP